MLIEEYRPKEFENRMTRLILGPKREEITGGWRKLHNGVFHRLHSSPNTRIIRVIKPRSVRFMGHVAHVLR
jgi:hypothetical protein